MAEGDFQTVSIYDPAIDYDAMTRERFAEFIHGEKRDVSLIKPKAGEHLAVYTLREIPDEVFDRYVGTQTTQEQQFAAAFRCALVSVNRGYDRHGKALPLIWRPASIFGGEGPRDSMGWILTADEVRVFDRPTVQEIGGVAYSRSVFCYRGKVRRWLLPPLSQEILAAVHSPSPAAPAPSSAEQPGTSKPPPVKPPVEPTTSATAATGSPSAAPGAAPATGSRIKARRDAKRSP